MVASQELEAGDVLRRFNAEVSKAEPRRGNNTNRYARSPSARCLEMVTVLWDSSYLRTCVYWVCTVFYCIILYFYARKGNGICMPIIVGLSELETYTRLAHHHTANTDTSKKHIHF